MKDYPVEVLTDLKGSFNGSIYPSMGIGYNNYNTSTKKYHNARTMFAKYVHNKPTGTYTVGIRLDGLFMWPNYYGVSTLTGIIGILISDKSNVYTQVTGSGCLPSYTTEVSIKKYEDDKDPYQDKRYEGNNYYIKNRDGYRPEFYFKNGETYYVYYGMIQYGSGLYFSNSTDRKNYSIGEGPSTEMKIQLHQYVLHFNGNGATSGVPDDKYGIGNVTIPSSTPTRSGYTFKGWEVGGKLYNPGNTININSDTTLTAKWELSSTTLSVIMRIDGVVTKNSSIGTFTLSYSGTTKYNITEFSGAIPLNSEITITPKSSDGIYIAPSNIVSKISASSQNTLYIDFKTRTYNIDCTVGETATAFTYKYKEEPMLSFTPTTVPGYDTYWEFTKGGNDEYNLDGEWLPVGIETKVYQNRFMYRRTTYSSSDKNALIAVKYAPKLMTIYFKVKEGIVIEKSLEFGSTIYLNAICEEASELLEADEHITKWTASSKMNGKDSFLFDESFNIDTYYPEITFEATVTEENTYIVRFSMNRATGTQPTDLTIISGGLFTIPTPSRPGCKFVGWRNYTGLKDYEYIETYIDGSSPEPIKKAQFSLPSELNFATMEGTNIHEATLVAMWDSLDNSNMIAVKTNNDVVFGVPSVKLNDGSIKKAEVVFVKTNGQWVPAKYADWIYPYQQGNVITVKQAYSATQTNDVLQIE